ncbi:recombinase family protein [Actinokineospora soli]
MRDTRVKPEKTRRAVLYLRVSSQGQVNTDYDPEGLSLPAQRKACVQRAKELGAIVVDEYIEPGKSAKELDKRVAFQDMRRRIKTRKDVDYVIVYQFNRAFRNAGDAAIVKKEFQKCGARLISTVLNLDDSPESDMIEGIMNYVDEYRIRRDAIDIKYKMGEKVKKGGTVNRANIGYTNVRIEIEGRNVADVVLDDERAPLIRQMFELYATGKYTYEAIEEIMMERGLRSRPTKRYPAPMPISIGSIGKILTNRYYCGYVKSSDGTEYKGRHPAIVSEELFDRVQRVIRAERGGGTRNRVHKHHAKGQLWCNRCGKRLIIARASGNGGIFFYYLCMGRQKKSCDLPYLRIEGRTGVESAIAQCLRFITTDEGFNEVVAGEINATLKDDLGTNERVRRSLTARLKELERRSDALLELVGEPEWPKDKLSARMQALRRECEGVERQLADTATALDAGHEVVKLGLEVLARPEVLYTTVQDDATKSIVLKAIFTKLYLDCDEDCRVTVAGQDLAQPFDALNAAETAWRATSGPPPHARTDSAGERSRGRRPDGATASADQTVRDLLASVFADRGSSRALLVEVPGIEPGSSVALPRLLRAQFAVSLLGPTDHAN